MGRKPVKRSPKEHSFIKVLNCDVSKFSKHLRIPPAFIKNFHGNSLRKCTLRGPSGTWDVELKRRKNGLFFRDDGWQGFVKDHALEKGDILVFSYNGRSKFNVTVYDKRCCEKDVEAAKKRSTSSPVSLANNGNQASVKVEIIDCETESDKDETESNKKDSETKTTAAESTSRNQVLPEKRRPKGYVEETATGSMVFKSENSCFMETMKTHLTYRMMIPKKIAVAEGHMSKERVILEDPSGRSWPVKLRRGGQFDRNRLLMTKGWAQCYRANHISHGDTIIFECVMQGVIQIHIFKPGDKRCPVELVAAS